MTAADGRQMRLSDDCSGRKTNETKWLLVQGAMAEMYARMAGVCPDAR